MNLTTTTGTKDYSPIKRKTNNGYYPWHSHPATIAKYCLGSPEPLLTAQFYYQNLGFELIGVHDDGYMLEQFGQIIFIGYTNGMGGMGTEAISVFVPLERVPDFYRNLKEKGVLVEPLEGDTEKGLTFELYDCDGNKLIFESYTSRMELGRAV